MNAVQKLQAYGVAFFIAAAVLAATAPTYNGQWLGSLLCFLAAVGLLTGSKVVEHRR